MLATVGSAKQSDSGIYAYSAWVPDFIPVTELARVYCWSHSSAQIVVGYYRIDSATSVYVEYGRVDSPNYYNRSVACSPITGPARAVTYNSISYDEEGRTTGVTGYILIQQGYHQKSNTRADGGVDTNAVNGTYPENGLHTNGYWYVRGARIS